MALPGHVAEQQLARGGQDDDAAAEAAAAEEELEGHASIVSRAVFVEGERGLAPNAGRANS